MSAEEQVCFLAGQGLGLLVPGELSGLALWGEQDTGVLLPVDRIGKNIFVCFKEQGDVAWLSVAFACFCFVPVFISTRKTTASLNTSTLYTQAA